MPIRSRIDGEAARADQRRNSKARHPLLKVGTRHFGMWETILNIGNPKGGITSAQLREAYPLYHPQLLADLQKAFLVAKNGKIGSNWKYVADPKGKGIVPQTVEVTVELYETDNGSFVTRTELKGRRDDVGKITKLLASKTITLDVPPTAIMDVAGDLQPDPEPDVYELHKHRKTARGANVIIDVDAPLTGDGWPCTDDGGWPNGNNRLLPYDPTKEDGCIIDQ